MKKKNYTRRNVLRDAGIGASALAFSQVAALGKISEKRPNIILIMADDLGYECLGCNGGTSYKTPVLDELARTGMRFEHCYVQPLCTPTRIQIMTGQYNFRNYKSFGIMDPEEKTFGHIMKDAGYATCIVGKWQLYSYNPPEIPAWRGKGMRPEQSGFDEYCLWHAEHTEDKESRFADPRIIQNGKQLDLKGQYGPDVYCDYLNDYMERNKTKPFFIYFPMALTHGPFVPTPDSEEWEEGNRLKPNKKYFGDMVEYMDKVIGRIIRKLDDLGLRENTLILFTGDNGSPQQMQSRMGDRVIQGGKGLTTDAGIHVPFIANWKGTIPAGKVCDDLVDSSDFLPTIADVGVASIPVDMIVDGWSFLPQLRGGKGNPRDWVFFHFDPQSMRAPQYTRKRFARDKKYKLYDNGELFDASADPLEKNPIKQGDGSSEAENARKKLQTVLDTMKKEWMRLKKK